MALASGVLLQARALWREACTTFFLQYFLETERSRDQCTRSTNNLSMLRSIEDYSFNPHEFRTYNVCLMISSNTSASERIS
ncbi:hypothetical protein Y032_0042g680 [Ancylostoma ceylanicum]|uniref:Uncharacterized protein n=1 Tax=Ancylostoma ceylanicum TaxID=53326 RepID=A0A016UGY0_9BILA|nr:hypothetical protein Y032_0042g680 [Ancylostoma ceylanicum]